MSGTLVDKELLKSFVPPSALNAENFQELSGKAFVEEVVAGRAIFNKGDTDKKTIYLIDGEVTMTSDSGEVVSIRSGTVAAKHPLASFQPRRHTAIAKSVCKITRIDSDLLDILMTWDQMSGIEVDEIHSEEEDEEGGGVITRFKKVRRKQLNTGIAMNKYTGKEFVRNINDAYWAAIKDGEIMIDNDRFPGHVFILQARERGRPFKQGEGEDDHNM